MKMDKVTVWKKGNSGQKERYALQNLYRSFAHNTFECMVRTTLDGEVLLSNHLFASTFHNTRSHRLRGTSILSLFSDPTEFTSLRTAVLEDGKVQSRKIRFVSSEGNIVTGLVNANTMADIHGLAVINWTILDISLSTASEDELQRKKQELEKVNGMMEKFLYSTSHDLRSPVTSILGLVHLMKLETRDQVLHDYIGKIEHCASKLDLIIRDLMGFSKTSYQRAKSSRLTIRDTVDAVIRKHSTDQNFAAITFDLVSDEMFPFYSDPDRIEIILDNVIRNTIHFRDTSKSRSVVRITIKVSLEEAYIEIHDNGIGIGKNHQHLIFNMFYKASNLSRGAGLGLYIAKESLHQIHGSISVESELGFGSIFRIRIPNDDKGKLIGKKILLSTPRD